MRGWRSIQPVVSLAARQAEDQGLIGLARGLGKTPTHAHRVLSTALGETPKEYTLRVRLDRAAGLLLTTRDTILDIALSCGFDSHEVLTRAFRRRFGMPPSAYRKRGVNGDAVAHAALVTQIGPCVGLVHLDSRLGFRLEAERAALMSYDIVVNQLDLQPVVVVKKRVARRDIAKTIATNLRSVFVYTQSKGIAIAGHPITRYPEYGFGMVTLETGMRVTSHPGDWKIGDGDGTVLCEALPAGPAATTVHTGPYDGLQLAYAALEEWIAVNQRQAAGAPWEVYLNDPGDFPDPKDWKTQVFWPLKA